MKKTLAIIMSIVMLLCAVPFTASAAETSTLRYSFPKNVGGLYVAEVAFQINQNPKFAGMTYVEAANEKGNPVIDSFLTGATYTIKLAFAGSAENTRLVINGKEIEKKEQSRNNKNIFYAEYTFEAKKCEIKYIDKVEVTIPNQEPDESFADWSARNKVSGGCFLVVSRQAVDEKTQLLAGVGYINADFGYRFADECEVYINDALWPENPSKENPLNFWTTELNLTKAKVSIYYSFSNLTPSGVQNGVFASFSDFFASFSKIFESVSNFFTRIADFFAGLITRPAGLAYVA